MRTLRVLVVSVDLNGGALRVELTRGEKWAALRRGNVEIPWLRRDPAARTLGDYRQQIREPVDSAVLEDLSTWIDDLARGSDRAGGAAGS